MTQTLINTGGYAIKETHHRVWAVDGKDIEIAGSFQPEGHSYWQLYVSRSVTDLTGLRTPPHREHFVGDHGRQDSRAWVEMIAKLYSLATKASRAA